MARAGITPVVMLGLAIMLSASPPPAADAAKRKPCPAKGRYVEVRARHGSLLVYSDGSRYWFCNRRTRRRDRLPYTVIHSDGERRRIAFAGPLIAYEGFIGSADNSVDDSVIAIYDVRRGTDVHRFDTSPPCIPYRDPRTQCGAGSSDAAVKLLLHRSGWAVWSLSREGFVNAVMVAGPGFATKALDQSDDLRAGSLRFADDGRVTWVSHGTRQYHDLP